MSLNINGITSKIENAIFLNLFRQYDIIFLSELKCSYPFSIPGYVCIRSDIVKGEEFRGGVAVLFRSPIWKFVYDIQKEHDQVWFRLKNTPNFLYGAVYIPPRDSPYYSAESFALLQSKCIDGSSKVLIMGDINSRISNLSQFENPPLGFIYSMNPDHSTNANGSCTVDICQACEMIPVNHLTYKGNPFPGALTYRQKSNWISQLDWAIISKSAVPQIKSFIFHKDLSLPTDHAAIGIKLENFDVTANELLLRAESLGSSHTKNPSLHKRPLQFQRINEAELIRNLPNTMDLWSSGTDANSLCCSITDHIYEASKKSSKTYTPQEHPRCENATQRWNILLSNKDPRKIWQAIGWKGTFEADIRDAPSDAKFCHFYQSLLNPTSESHLNYVPTIFKYIPILDDPISPGEVDDGINKLDKEKAAGIDGVPPGILKLLPDEWILVITFLFNLVFSGMYPNQWSISKIFNIYKKGCSLNPSNYRGISILVALAKLYDYVLTKRLTTWYKPKIEQAGSQKGRGCEEQILTLRLLIDIARKTKQTLYIAFIDYVKAYDKVNRNKLLQILDSKGCGSRFLSAIASTLTNSSGVIGSESFQATAGVRQGASLSCSLFILYVESTIEAVSSSGPDGWLGNLHSLLLMDDTAVLATSRESMLRKLTALKACTDNLHGEIHPNKSAYFTVNTNDTSDFILDNVTIAYCNEYTYLGTPLSNNTIAEQVKQHLSRKASHVIKYTSFLNKNSDAPYKVKQQVWHSALQSALFYSCETWLTSDLRSAESVYMSTLKQLLGIRHTTCNDICLVEASVGNAKSYIQERQKNFLYKLMGRENFNSSYVGDVINLAIQVKCPSGKVLTNLKNLGSKYDYCANSLDTAKNTIRTSNSTRRTTYLTLNPKLSFNEVYKGNFNIPEFYRITFTRLRTSSHRLRIETGRWSRIPRELRTCPCGEIQTEEHVLLRCPMSQDIRSNLSLTDSYRSAAHLLNAGYPDIVKICHFCTKILGLYS